MRALGPGSVSSVLKIILDVVYFALWVLATLTAVGAAGALIFAFAPGAFEFLISDKATVASLAAKAPLTALRLAGATLYTIGVIVITGRLRSVFAALSAGDPFHPDNVRRLRVIGLILAGLELGRYALAAGTALWAPGANSFDGPSLTPWFAVLVIFVLAEVFREGARLRREAELTI